jgi:FkbH-like protein
MLLSFAQQRLWFLNQLEPESAAYHVPIAVHLNGFLDVDALQHALQTIIQRHEILRTTFVSVGGSPEQIIGPARPIDLKLVDLREASTQERDVQTQHLLIEESDRAFDLACGPLIRFTLLRLNEEENILVLVMHHIIFDGWSMGVLFGELGKLYDAFSAKAPGSLPEVSVQYADFARWQQQTSQEKMLQEDSLYWKEKLAGAPVSLTLPTDHPPGVMPALRAAQQTVVLPESLLESVRALGRREGSTLYMTVMTALVIALHQWTKQQEFVLGTVVAGRKRKEIETLIGCFMNFLPLRMRLFEKDTGLDVLTRVKAAVLEGLAHQDCPFQKIVEAVNPERKLNENPLYNVAFLLQNYPRNLLGSDRVQARLLPVEARGAVLDLRFVAEEIDTLMTLTCEYRQALFDAKTMEALLALVCRTLETLVRDPQRKLSDFERSATLEAQIQTARSLRAKQCIAIAATFTVEPVEESLQFWIKELNLPASIAFTPYNQVFQQLLDPASRFASNRRGMNVVLIRLEDWLGTETTPTVASRAKELVERNARELLRALKTAASRSMTPLLLCICPASKASAANAGQAALFRRVEIMLADGLRDVRHVSLLISAELLSLYPVADYDDPHGNELGHIPYTPLLFAALGTMISRKFDALNRAPYKVIVLDCDQTLWSGVCGEDGTKGIAIDPPRLALQHFMCAQRDAGMLLCLCSKNNQEDVAAVFASRPEMPLRREHFAASRVNWHPKSENLKSLAKELRLGLESFIFVDDSPLECAEVEANCPQVLTLLLPKPERVPQFLNHCWAFDHGKATTEDQQRTVSYQQNRQREKFQTQAGSMAEFIAGLNLKIRIEESAADQLPRVAQLTERTNQFNCMTRRRTESELQLLLDSGNKVLAVSVSDRFGDYGLVGVMIYKEMTDAIAVDTFLLSCRVLGKGVEHQMLAQLGRLATLSGIGRVDVSFRASPKNQPALDFLEKVGIPFRQECEGGFVFRFSAGFAAALTFNPQGEIANGIASPTEISGNGHAEVAAGVTSTLHRWIATEADSANAVLEAIESKARARPRQGVNAAYAAPSTELQKQLCEIWEQLLRINRVGVHDNFFELGGHSLLAARLAAEVNNRFGCKLPIAALFQSPTVESLTRRLTEEHWAPPWSSLVPLQPLGAKPPFFLVHGWGGDVYGFLGLAQLLAPDQPAYGLQAVGLDGKAPRHITVEDMAAHYVQEIRSFQPEGPYFLGGYSMGGLIAFEMAQQLYRLGQRVALLALLDSPPSCVIPWAVYGRMMASYLRDRCLFHLRRWWEMPNRDRLSYFRGRWAALQYWINRNRSKTPAVTAPFKEDSQSPLVPGFPDYYVAVASAYRIRPYPGSADVFVCDNDGPRWTSCWTHLARGRVSFHGVPGTHLEMLAHDYVPALGRALRTVLHRAQENARLIAEAGQALEV